MKPSATTNAQPQKAKPPSKVPAIFQVVVTCQDERDQEAVYRQMKAQGRKCRVLTL